MEHNILKRGAGILLHISSLPSPHGIGTLGKEAYSFSEFLSKAGQKYWQILPVGPTGYGNSPYNTFSAYAGNPYLIDLDTLISDGLLKRSEVESASPESGRFVDYGALYEGRDHLLRLAYSRIRPSEIPEFEKFKEENSFWLSGYSLFTALKQHFKMRPYWEWDNTYLCADALNYSTMPKNTTEEIEFASYKQYLFFSQWKAFREHLSELGIVLIGDIPIYCPQDSAEVWLQPKFFEMDEKRRPMRVAGVPPDYFSENGQLWGNPLYNWEEIRRYDWSFWTDRIKMAAQMFDVVRLDHFRGFDSYWAVPAENTTAKGGVWVSGPGIEFIDKIKQSSENCTIVAEDLGILSESAIELLKKSGFPGMKVLQFAFDSDENNLHLPHCYDKNCICYAGTHDNKPLAAFFDELSPTAAHYAARYLGLTAGSDPVLSLLRCGYASVANLFIAQMQDYLRLGNDCRMNTPGSGENNWRWRMLPGEASDDLAEKLLDLALTYGR